MKLKLQHLEADSYELIFEVDRAIRQLKTRQSWTSIKKEIVQIYGKKDENIICISWYSGSG